MDIAAIIEKIDTLDARRAEGPWHEMQREAILAGPDGSSIADFDRVAPHFMSETARKERFLRRLATVDFIVALENHWPAIRAALKQQ